MRRFCLSVFSVEKIICAGLRFYFLIARSGSGFSWAAEASPAVEDGGRGEGQAHNGRPSEQPRASEHVSAGEGRQVQGKRYARRIHGLRGGSVGQKHGGSDAAPPVWIVVILGMVCWVQAWVAGCPEDNKGCMEKGRRAERIGKKGRGKLRPTQRKGVGVRDSGSEVAGGG